MNLDRQLLAEARRAPLYLLLTVGTGLLAGIATILQAGYLSRIVDLVFLQGRSLGGVQAPLVGLFLVTVARAGLVWVRDAAASWGAGRIKASIRERLFVRLLELGPMYARGERTGELANTVVEGVEALDGYFSQYLPSLALALLIPATILLFVFPVDLLSGLVFLLTAPLIPVFMVLIGKLAESMTRKQWESLSRMSAHFLDVLQGLPTLKMFGRSKAQVETMRQVSDRFREATMGVLKVAFLSALVLEMAATISTAIVAVEVGLRLLYGTIPFERALFVLILAPEFYLPLRALGASFHSGMSGVAAARRIYQVLDEGTPRRGDTETRGEDTISALDTGISIRFDDVHFSYEGRQRPALRGISFEMGEGEKVALVGPSGSGKSTIAYLLLRFVEPDGGRILVNGTPLQRISPSEWRKLVAWVPQSPYIFNTTVAENIHLARPAARMEEVVRAAKWAHADQFIRGLPQGYDTPLGERGARLSGGQAQRIALARAFLKNAPLLILDEAASHLDIEQEALLQDSLKRLTQGRTVLTIAHRLSTVHNADRILVLERGRVVEIGNHRELLQRDGLYRRLVAAYGELETEAPLASEPGSDLESAATSCSPRSGPKSAAMDLSVPASSTEDALDSGVARPSPSGVLWRLLRLAAALRGKMALAALAGFATISSGIGLMATAAFIIASAALHPSVADLAVPIVGVRFFGISRGVLRYLERYLSHEVNFRLLAQLRLWFYQSVEPLAPARLMSYKSGDLLSRVVADVESLQSLYVGVIAPPAVALLVAALTAAFLWEFDPMLTWILIAFFFLSGAALPLLIQQLGLPPGKRITTFRSALNAELVDGIQGMADLVASGAEPRQLARVGELNRRVLHAESQMARISGLHAGLGTLLANLGAWSILLAAIPLIGAARLDGVFLALLILAALASFEAVAPLAPAFQQLGKCREAGRRLLEILDRAPGNRDQATGPRVGGRGPGGGESAHPREQDTGGYPQTPDVHALPLGEGALRVPPSPRLPAALSARFRVPASPCLPVSPSPSPAVWCLVAENVRFRYAPSEPPALDGVSFRLPRGSRLAIVGPNGAGKSTLVHLLLRFWEYQEGSILLDGRELREYPEEKARRKMAVISQRTHLFNTTIRENLLIARPEASEDELTRAVLQAQLHSFIKTLPRGLDTWVGEQGLRLSDGERQRIAIARALLADAPLLILDEPTSNLDSITEREVSRSIATLMQGRTTLLITHRIGLLDAMEEILVLASGRVVESGRHQDLLRRNGLYRRLWQMQRQPCNDCLVFDRDLW